DAPHAVEAVGRVFEVSVSQPFDRLADADGLLNRPGAVGIDAEAVAGKRLGQSAEALDLVVRVKHAGLELVACEAMLGLEFSGVRDQLLGRTGLTAAFIGIAEKQV